MYQRFKLIWDSLQKSFSLLTFYCHFRISVLSEGEAKVVTKKERFFFKKMISRTGSGYISFTDRIRIYYFTERTGSISLTDRIRIHYFTDRSRVDSFTDRIRIILKNRIRVDVFYRPMKWIQNTLDITRDFTQRFIIIFTFLFCLFVCLSLCFQ